MRSSVPRSLLRARPGRGADAGVGVAAAAGVLYAPFNVAFQSTRPSIGAFLLVTFVSALLSVPAGAAWGAFALRRSRGALIAGYAAGVTGSIVTGVALLPDLFMVPPPVTTQALLTAVGAGLASLIVAFWLSEESRRELRSLRPGQTLDPSLVPSQQGGPQSAAHLTGPAPAGLTGISGMGGFTGPGGGGC